MNNLSKFFNVVVVVNLLPIVQKHFKTFIGHETVERKNLNTIFGLDTPKPKFSHPNSKKSRIYVRLVRLARKSQQLTSVVDFVKMTNIFPRPCPCP